MEAGEALALARPGAYQAFVKQRARRQESGRCALLVDSRVTLCSGAKGRSPSEALGRRWRLTLPWLIGGKLYIGFFFVPTRKNPSDAPSRFRSLWLPAGDLPRAWDRLASGDFAEWDLWIKTGPVPRAVAGWAQLYLRLADASDGGKGEGKGEDFLALCATPVGGFPGTLGVLPTGFFSSPRRRQGAAPDQVRGPRPCPSALQHRRPGQNPRTAPCKLGASRSHPRGQGQSHE